MRVCEALPCWCARAPRIPLITFPSVRGLPDHVPSLKLKLPGGLEGGPIVRAACRGFPIIYCTCLLVALPFTL